ncbi:hypothetical protein NON00_05855 [Roseomonas sp. GC11]|uniref:hypothetical protein n=1 Tax=Roseomonas sp. GC11 TaxID=2950546 RepID=UPI00210B19C8|nr:hypothetical protein [Roseomonas sp. GC11]MCQ4159447.1 hypothetical protein [Roseomonas sp. GC11]
MQSTAGFLTMATTLGASYTPLERSFSLAGQDLERAATALGGLVNCFEGLEQDLRGPALVTALAQLDQAADSVRNIDGIIRAERQVLDRIFALLQAIAGHLGHLDGTVRAVGMLTVTAKVCASGLGALGEDFSAFTREITRLFDLSRTSLAEFLQVVTRLQEKLQAGLSRQDNFARQQGDAIQNIPATLSQSTAALQQRMQAGAAASGEVRARSAAMAQAVSEAIMALQVADATRQRIQHVEEVIGGLPSLLSGPAMPEADRPLVRAHVCHLQAALLRHAAEEYEAHAGRVDGALDRLSQEARAVLQIGTEAYGQGGERRGNFLAAVETSVRHALGLVRDFRTAQAEVAAVAQDITASVLQLSEHIGLVRALETDLRLMSLNMTLKSGRLHDAGRTLHTIARELRSCADQTTQIVGLITRDLTSVTELAQNHAQRGQTAEERALADLNTLMAGAMDALGGVGRQIGTALASLEQGGSGAAGALAQARERLAAAGIAAILHRVAGELDGQAGGGSLSEEELSRIRPLLPASLSSRYTMESERAVQARLSGQTAYPTPAPTNTLEDILF